jgi:hypothetical protein
MSDPRHTPCQQERTIAVIRTDITDVKGGFRDMIAEFRALTKDLRESLLDGRELKVEVNTLKRDTDQCFVDIRETNRRQDLFEVAMAKELTKIRENRITPLETWQATANGRFAAVKTIPVICAVIVALLTIFNFTSQIDPTHSSTKQQIFPH